MRLSSLQVYRNGHAEHDQVLQTAKLVSNKHEVCRWRNLAIRFMGKKWALIAKMQKCVMLQKYKLCLQGIPEKGKAVAESSAEPMGSLDKGKAIAVSAIPYPPPVLNKLLTAPHFQRIWEILPEQQGTLLNKE